MLALAIVAILAGAAIPPKGERRRHRCTRALADRADTPDGRCAKAMAGDAQAGPVGPERTGAPGAIGWGALRNSAHSE